MKKVVCAIMLTMFFSTFLLAQDEVTDVNKEIDHLRVFEKVVQDGYGTPRLYGQLADGYYFKSDYQNARKWFKKLFASNDNKYIADPQVRRRYRQTLKALGLDAKELENLGSASIDRGVSSDVSKGVDKRSGQE